jgi:excinuclease UvrABC nuclease subunit
MWGALPECSGIYALHSAGNPPHLSWCVNLRRRLTRLLVPSYTAAQKHFSKYTEKICEVRCWPAGSRLESALILYALTRHYYPADYLRRLRLRMPWFVSLSANDRFPRLEVSNRLGRNGTEKFGPFLNRDAAAQHEEEILSLHQLRRCSETLLPSDHHPGCIYGEMNQCLRPCQCAVSAEEYASEVSRVRDFLFTAGKSALQPLAAARDRAAEALDFEQAAIAHKRIEKVQAAAATRDKVIGPVAQFHGVALTKSHKPDSVCLWPMLGAYWQAPIILQVQSRQANAAPLDATIRETLTLATHSRAEDGNPLEHLALFSRWYYSSWRDGHWFPFQNLPDLNYRRLVREISNLMK